MIGKATYYLPLDCPICGRHRLEFFSNYNLIKCEKCGITSEDFPTDIEITKRVIGEYRQAYKKEFGYAITGDIDHALFCVEHWLDGKVLQAYITEE